MYTKNILLIGYWPPTNIMLKQFSRRRIQNEGNYVGENWEGLGYNIFAFFPDFNDDDVFEYDRSIPEFPVGTGSFKIDYQDTFRDFVWATEYYKPCAIISFSRMGDWEEIVLEPGHMVCEEWAPDKTHPTQPSKSIPYWLNHYTGLGEAGTYLQGSLPRNKIVEAAVSTPELDGLRIWAAGTLDTTGDFLSNYIGALGARYKKDHGYSEPGYQCRVSGHVHVGGGTPVEKVKVFSEVALRETIGYIDNYLNSTWIYTFAIRLAQSNAPDAGTASKLIAKLYRDDYLISEKELDWADRGDFLMPGIEHLHVMSFGDRKRDPLSEYPSSNAPLGGIEFANGIHGHFRIELENPSNDIWRSDLIEILVKEKRQSLSSDGEVRWRTDRNFTRVYSNLGSRSLATDRDGFDSKETFLV
ncbi:MAG: hypothetical protein HKN52_10225 [Eudoraea sp.]|nr:hypothetical protein [Eudoraea sp.]